MADGGMLLNFDLGNGIIAPKADFKGGKWKDRMIAKKTAGRGKRPQRDVPAGGQANTERNPRESEHSDPDTGARSPKRQRLDGGQKPTSTFNAPQGGQKTQSTGAPATARGPQKEVISSLFTFNPQATTKAGTQAKEDETPIEPSNAPLSSELETFTSLGLTPTIASHLLNKMNIKAPTAIQKAAITQLLQEDSDAFIQAETGSGKTLAYLLPIVLRIMKLTDAAREAGIKEKDAINRKSGLFAVVLAPTRELSKQIQVVLESLLRCANWIVSGIVIGGESKSSEKARLRKGVNILVATPGRLADHLQHTEALDVSTVRWLVLDEGDRLMELGFENDIQRIVGVLNQRLKASAGKTTIHGLPSKRTTVLCSATLKVDVQRLGEISLKDAAHIKKDPKDIDPDTEPTGGSGDADEFSAPAQLKQSYAIVPMKLRLVSLIAYLKRAFERRGSVMKAIVFISCADSVDFHFDVLTKIVEATSEPVAPGQIDQKQGESNSSTSDTDTEAAPKPPAEKKNPFAKFAKGYKPEAPVVITHAPATMISSSTNPVTAYRLHGSLQQAVRTSTITHFTKSTTPSVLLATDVASRGLDVPNVDLVLEYDPAFARDDHLHRIGRTARAGRPGRACVFLTPGCEEKYIEILARDRRDADGSSHLLRQTGEEILKKAFTPNKPQNPKTRDHKQAWDTKATDLQLSIEQWVIDPAHPERKEAAARGWQGQYRAYMTHVAAERECFDVKEFHPGHSAKAFGLRDPPKQLGRHAGSKGVLEKKGRKPVGGTGEKRKMGDGEDGEPDEAARKMREKVRKMKMMSGGADEFNLG